MRRVAAGLGEGIVFLVHAALVGVGGVVVFWILAFSFGIARALLMELW